MNKICSKCKVERLLTEFDYRKSPKFSYETTCKFCRRLRQNAHNKLYPRQDYYKLHPEKHRPAYHYYKYVKARRQKAKQLYGIGGGFFMRYGVKTMLFLFEKYNKQCAKCFSNQDLTVHHKDGKGRGYWEKTGQRMNNNLDNLELLCRKCHGSMEGKKSVIVTGKTPSSTRA